MTLDRLPLLQPATVRALGGAAMGWAQQLQDLGFEPGETVRVLRRAPWGGDPLVVQVGATRFALRRAEAACVELQPQK
ncbi:ferrous iron transport protein A [Inhella inkyongensis]|uniref:Ferrous iron transport protein A n=1 Tax=Inhella inkyongensis TaxID=392593 RepID=A0A840S3C5_9BURK|nr:FeoA family protein [Inhella inkyongensis]MBB5205727.1 ferrous iron transport protein A [Inhella inkyongensis]